MPAARRATITALLALFTGYAAPATAAEPSSQPAADSTASHGAQLSAELSSLFSTPPLKTAVVGALAQSLDTGETLFTLNADTLVVPASNMKVITAAVAASRLGWEYHYETRLEALLAPEAGVLTGDLFVVGGGDPTIHGTGGDRFTVFREWAARLKAAGITRISGRIVGDDDTFDDERFGDGWTWDDLVFAYTAPVGALEFNENSVEVVVRPGRRVGDAALIELQPAGSDLTVSERRMTTAPAGSPNEVSIARTPGSTALLVSGSIALGSQPHIARAAVDNPTQFFVTVFRDVLRSQGIAVDGPPVDIDDVPDSAALKATSHQRTVIWRHESAPLAEIVKTMMKLSPNLYGETVLRSISLTPGPASVKASRELAAATLEGWGLAQEQFRVADGSGLSRLNLVSATGMVRVLTAMAGDPNGTAFEAALPVAGRDGTFARRLKATRAEGNALAKTGTLTSVRCLSGYVRTADGERIAFAFLVNNFLAPSSSVDALVNRAVERLADFAR